MIVLIASLLILAVGVVYQAIASWRDNEKYPAPGQLVKTTIGEVHIQCQGNGAVTVILEAGQGDSSLDWADVKSEVVRFARVCAYDRPGLGWSSVSQGVMSSADIADNLHQALQGAGIMGPYVLAGHSIGGVYMREFARQYAEEVVGLVLVDSAHENQRFRLPPDILKKERVIEVFAMVFRVLAPLGIVRGLRLADRLQGDNFADDVRPAAIARMNQSHFFKALYDEVKTAELNAAQKEPPRNLGDMRLIVLSRGGDNPGFPEADFVELKQIWDAMQRELVDLSTNGRQIVADKSGHYIHHDQPELVVEAVRELVGP